MLFHYSRNFYFCIAAFFRLATLFPRLCRWTPLGNSATLASLTGCGLASRLRQQYRSVIYQTCVCLPLPLPRHPRPQDDVTACLHFRQSCQNSLQAFTVGSLAVGLGMNVILRVNRLLQQTIGVHHKQRLQTRGPVIEIFICMKPGCRGKVLGTKAACCVSLANQLFPARGVPSVFP